MTADELMRLLLALTALLSAAHLLGFLCERLHLPRVAGEIGAGLVLGPSLLGWLMPEAVDWLFVAFSQQESVMSAFYWLGMVMLMFISGFQVQRDLASEDWRTVVVLLFGTGLAFAAGWAATRASGISAWASPTVHPLAFDLIMATAVSVTSIPVLSKIFIDLGIIHSRFSSVVLTTASVQDLILWTAVAFATSIDRGESADTAGLLQSVLLVTGFVLVSGLLGFRSFRLFDALGGRVLKRASPIAYLMVICFGLVAVAVTLKVNVMFGALVAGLLVGALPKGSFQREKEEVARFSMSVFVPLYFALVGLRIDLPEQFDLTLTVAFLLWSSAIKTSLMLAAAKVSGRNWLTSFNLAVAMNTRGGPGIVLASLAYELNMIQGPLFVALIAAALLTSVATGAWLRALIDRGLPIYAGSGSNPRPEPPPEAELQPPLPEETRPLRLK